MADILLVLPVLLFSVVAHEYAHAWTAFREGDDTAQQLGRLTMHPLPHLDLVNSLILPVGLWILSNGTFTFGAAKPVPVNPANYRHPRRGDLVVSLAGITMNLLLAVAGGLLFAAFGILGQGIGATAAFLIPGVANVLFWPATAASRATFAAIGRFALPGLTP